MAKPCTPHLIAQRVQLFKPQTANVKAFLLDGHRPFSFLGKKMGGASRAAPSALPPRGTTPQKPFAPVRKSRGYSLT